MKDIPTFNEDFQKIVLDIPTISMSEKIDRYCRGLKPYIWKELCANDYEDLSDVMTDALRIESATKRLRGNGPTFPFRKGENKGDTNDPTHMEIGNIELKKLSKEEREECMKKGLCLRCRQPGHIAKNCPKARRD